jgi:deoxyribodipyrimidine photo-lyase
MSKENAPRPAAEAPALVWLRQDLRLADNPAIAAAVASGRPVAFAYVLDDETPGRWRWGGASRWWLHQSLSAMANALGAIGGALILRRGRAEKVIPALARELAAGLVVWNRLYEPYSTARDAAIKAGLLADGVAAESYNGALLVEPWQVKTGAGGSFKVFSPFWRAAQMRGLSRPLHPAPDALRPVRPVASEALESWRLEPKTPDWAGGLRASWRPGEAGAKAQLSRFIADAFHGYAEGRDRPDQDATSRLSPHLHWGEISPAQVLAAIETHAPSPARSAEKLASELGWREFAHHVLFHHPTIHEANLRREFDAFPWAQGEETDARFRAWTRGETGYPIVDAGMRQLWATGWMHNRVRMIAASFLIKHLMIDWRRGAAWFWDTLCDADLANNAMGWQWVAGSGADAAPFFRIFNPTLQGQKFDPEGAYVRAWVPELRSLPATFVHTPWQRNASAFVVGDVEHGRTYPAPIVDHGAARRRALAAFAGLPRP